jgi:hypothetical protein
MLRVSDEIRAAVMQLAREWGGVSADEAVRRLIEEHEQAAAIAAVQRYREENPQGWAEYLAEADADAAADAPITDGWHEPGR